MRYIKKFIKFAQPCCPPTLNYELQSLQFQPKLMLIVLVACPALPAGTNTKSVSDGMADSAVGTNYTYECLDGYKPSSDGLVTTCLITGKWSLQTPKCEGKYFC